MTLNLSILSPLFCITASDRKTTTQTTDYDHRANKLVVYAGKTSIFNLTYTGEAFIGNLHTDEWIAEIIHGCSIEKQFPGGTAGMGFGESPRSKKDTLDNIISDLKRELDNLLSSKQWRRDSFLEISIAGWHMHNRQLTPVIAKIEKRGSDPSRVKFSAGYTRFSNPQENVALMVSGNWVRKYSSQFGALLGTYPKIAPKNWSPLAKNLEDGLVRLIRIISKNESSIGMEVMTSLLPRPNWGENIIRIHQQEILGQILIQKQEEKFHLNGYFTPWIIGPHGYSCPQLIIGSGSHYNFGGQSVVVQTAYDKNTHGIHYASIDQCRKRAP